MKKIHIITITAGLLIFSILILTSCRTIVQKPDPTISESKTDRCTEISERYPKENPDCQDVDDLPEIDDNIEEALEGNPLKDIAKLCTKEDKSFLIISEYVGKSEAIRIGQWKGTEWEFSPQLTGLMDFYYEFYPNALGENHLIRTGFSDVGHSSWTFYSLDKELNTFTLLAKCSS